MEKLKIIALHLAFGGIEKAICSMANLFADRYEVEIISVYDMPGAPAFPLDERVRVRYLLRDVPNREEFMAALHAGRPAALLREGVKSVRILHEKKKGVIDAIQGISEGIVITTRHEDNRLLSKYGRPGVLKIAQIHRDHGFDPDYVRGFQRDYGGIDILAMLTPQLRDEVRELMRGYNAKTRVEYVPNFLERYPERVSPDGREKTVLAVGRLNELKRFALLIRCFAEVHGSHPDWTLRIVGEGEERASLEALIGSLGAAEYVTLTGKQDSAGVEREMLRASVYAMSSSTEGFPFVLLEAQSCALPVIAFDVRVGPGFVVENGVSGCLVPEGETQSYVRRLAELMDDAVLRRKMGTAATANAARFSKQEVARIWDDVIGGQGHA